MADYASEQTLQDLLAATQAMNANLSKLAATLGRPNARAAAPASGGGGNSAAAGVAAQAGKILPVITGMTKGFSILSIAVTAVTGVFKFLGNIISSVISGFTKTAGIIGEFAAAASKGGVTLTDTVNMVGDILGQIPGIGKYLQGFAGIIAFVTQRLEETYKVYGQLANAGITFSGNLMQMRQDIQQAGLTINEFVGIASKNSDVFATMGSNVQKGADVFLRSQRAMMGPGSQVAKGFDGLGLGAQEAAGYLGLYMRSQGSMNKQGVEDAQKNAEGALELAQQFQYLSDVTGKHKDQIQAELEASMKEQNWQAYLATLTADQAKEATEKLNSALQIGGKDAADMVKTGMMTGIVQPMTESQKRQDAITHGALTKLSTGIVKATGTYEQRMSQIDDANLQYVKGTEGAYQQFKDVSALQVAQNKQGLFTAEQIANRNRFVQDGKLKSDQAILTDQEKARANVKKLTESEAQIMGQNTRNLKNFGASINSIIDNFIAPFLGPILGAVTTITDGLGKYAPQLAQASQKFAEWLKPWVDKVSAWFTKWFDKFANSDSDIPTMLKEMWEEAKDAVGPILRDVFDFVGATISDMMLGWFGRIFKSIWDFVSTPSKWFGGSISSPAAPKTPSPSSAIPAPATASTPKAAAPAAAGATSPELAAQASASGAAPVQNGGSDPVSLLNTNIATLITTNQRIADNTERAADLLSGRGNLFKPRG
jgi:hypothetical protein